MVTNKESENTMRDELIEALKGLTFKFEVKIVDVLTAAEFASCSNPGQSHDHSVAPSTDDHIQKGTPPSISVKPGQIELKEEKIVSQPKIEHPQISNIPDIPTPPQEPQEEPAALNKTEPIKEQFTAPPTLVPMAVRENAIKRLQDRSRKAQSKQLLIRGTLTLNSVVTACCIAIDSTTVPLTSYIAYDNTKLLDITKAISDVAMDIENSKKMSRFEVGDIVLAKSKEDNAWYRSIIEQVTNMYEIRVYFFDWGLKEDLESERIRHLTQPDLGLSKHPACAVKVKFINPPGPEVDEAYGCESEFKFRVDTYDESTETYTGYIFSN